MFDQGSVNLDILKRRAYNLRWATLPDGVIPLTAADPDFPSAPEIAAAICDFTKERYLCYGPPEGLPEFRQSMATYFQRKRNIPADAAFIFPVDSAAFGIYLTCRAFLAPGDEAIIFDPVDFLFRYSIEAVGGRAVPLAIPPAQPVDFDKLEKLVTKKTKMLCLCNPLNPTGKVFTKSELELFADFARRHNLIIMSDEIWSDIVFAPHTFTSIASLSEETRSRTVTITGFSKSYGIAGLRIGAVMAHNAAHFKRLIDASLHQSTIHGANVLSQVAATAALDQCQPWLAEFLAHLRAMRDLCVKELNALPGVSCIAPEGCYVAFADIRGTHKGSREIQEILLNSAKVAVVPGLKEWFGEGAEGFIRISFATSKEILTEAFTRISKTLK
jgi:aspartate/methionine/tyrosine aminotransferase